MDIKEIKKLSVGERLSVIGEIWESIDKEEVQITDAQKLEVGERIERYKKGQTKFFSWEEIKAKINMARSIIH